MAKISTPSDTTVVAVHGRRSTIDDVTLSQSPVPEASSTASKTRLEKPDISFQPSPHGGGGGGGGSGSSLGLLCLDELSAMSVHTAEADDHTPLPRGDLSIDRTFSHVLPPALTQRSVLGSADNSDDENDTDTMMPAVKLADEELQRLAQDLSDFDCNSPMLSSDEYDETEERSSNVGYRAYYDLGSHQDGDGVEDAREAGAGRYSSDDEDVGAGAEWSSSARGSGTSDVVLVGVNQGPPMRASSSAALTSSRSVLPTTDSPHPPPSARPDLIGSSSGGSRSSFGAVSRHLAEAPATPGPQDGYGRFAAAEEVVRQRAEGRSEESSGSRSIAAGTQASMQQARCADQASGGARDRSVRPSPFEPDNPEAQRRMRPMGDDLFRLPMPPPTGCATSRSVTTGVSPVGQIAGLAKPTSCGGSSSADDGSLAAVSAGPVTCAQSDECETSQQLASRYMLPGATEDEEDDEDAGNVAMSSASEVTLTGFLHSPPAGTVEATGGFATSFADQQDLNDYLGSEVFKSGASAIDILKQDELFCAGSKTTSTLSENTAMSWVADAAGRGATPSTSIEQYMAVRTEAVGSLSGRADTRPGFGDGTIVSPPTGVPRRLLLPDESATTVSQLRGTGPFGEVTTESRPRITGASPGDGSAAGSNETAQPVVSVIDPRNSAANVEMSFREKMAAAGPFTGELPSVGGAAAAHITASQKVSPIKARPSSAFPKTNTEDLSSLWLAADADHGSRTAVISSLNSTLKPSTEMAVDRNELAGRQSVDVAATFAAGKAAVPPEQVGEQSSIVSYSFVSKITAEARKAGAASSELAAYIIRLSQQQQQAKLQAPLPQHDAEAAASVGVGASLGAAASGAAASSTSNSGLDSLQTAALAGVTPAAASDWMVNASSGPGSPIGRSVPRGPQDAEYRTSGQAAVSCNALGSGHANGKCTAASVAVSSLPATATGASASLAVAAPPAAVSAAEDRLYEPLPPLVAAAECGCSSSRNACRQQLSTTASPAKQNAAAGSADSSWFWSSDATVSSSKSLNLDLSSVEGGSLQKPHGELSDHVRLSAPRYSAGQAPRSSAVVDSREGVAPVSAAATVELAAGSVSSAVLAGSGSFSLAAAAAPGRPISAVGLRREGVSTPASVDRVRGGTGAQCGSSSSLTSLSAADDGSIAAAAPLAAANSDRRQEEAGVTALAADRLAPASAASPGRPPIDLGRAVSLTSPSLLPTAGRGDGRGVSPQPFVFSTARGFGESPANSMRHPESAQPLAGDGSSRRRRQPPAVLPPAEQSATAGLASLLGRSDHDSDSSAEDRLQQQWRQSPRVAREVLQQNPTPGSSSALLKHQPQQRQHIGYDVPDLCTVQVPSEVRIEEVCCVGFSLQTQLEMYNRNNRWVSVTLKVANQSLDGSEEKCAKAVPFILKQKARLEPGTTEILPIVFAPQKPGIYMAQLLVETNWLVPVTREDGRGGQLAATSIVNIIANAELPRIEALNVTDGCVNFGYVPWKCTRRFQVSLVNKGHAGIPLRLIISSLKGSTYGCFCFSSSAAAGSDGGLREGPKVVQNLVLPSRSLSNGSSTAASQDIMPIDVALTFAAPAKSCGSTNEAEIFQAVLNVELDNPSAVRPLLTVKLQATVGAAKIHTPAVEGVKLAGVCGSVIQEPVPIRNAGTIPFWVQFSILGEDGEAFTVLPSRAYLDPNEDFKAVVKCDTRRLSSTFSKSMLLMSVEPDGPTFEVGLTVHANAATAIDVAGLNRRAASASDRLAEQQQQHFDPRSRSSEPLLADREQQQQHLTRYRELQLPSGVDGAHVASGDRHRKLFGSGNRANGAPNVAESIATPAAVLYSNKSCLTFGGVPVGHEVEQSFNLRNVLASCVRIALDISLSSKTRAAAGGEADRTCFRLVGFDSSSGGGGSSSSSRPAGGSLSAAAQELVLMPFEDYTVRIRFVPRRATVYGAKLKIFCAHNGATYMVRMSGYGGTGSISLEPFDVDGGYGSSSLLETRRGVWQLSLDHVSASRRHLVSADVQLRNVGSRSVFVRAACFADRDCEEKMSIGKVAIQPEQFVLAPCSTKVISVTYSMSEKDRIACEKAGQIVGVVSLYYGDEIVRQKLKRFLKSSTANIKMKSRHRLVDYNFDFYFLHEEEFDEDVCLPDDPREVDYFFSSLKECRLELVIYPSVASDLSHKRAHLANDISMEPLMVLNDTTCTSRDPRLLTVDGQPSTRYPAERPMLDVAFDSSDVSRSWSVEPSAILLTLVKTELERQIKKVKIVNNSDDPLPFDISWPASYVVVTPESGTVEPRSFVSLCLSAKVGLSRPLPWSGSLYVMARAAAKPISLVIEEARTSAFALATDRAASTHSTPRSSSHSASARDVQRLPGGSENGKYRPILESNHHGGTQDLSIKREVERQTAVGLQPLLGDKQSAARASGNSAAVYVKHKEHFPVTPVGQSSTVKITLCNRSSTEQRVSLSASSPFTVKQTAINVRPGHFVKLPVTFRPTAVGISQGQLLLITADGKKQSLSLEATTAP